MNVPPPVDAAASSSAAPPPPSISAPPTPFWWRAALFGLAFAAAAFAFSYGEWIGLRGQAACGFIFFIAFIAGCSQNLRLVNYRTLAFGFALQLLLAVAVLKVDAVRGGFEVVGTGVKKLIGYSDEGAKFVFGNLADPRPPQFGGTWSRLFPPSADGKETYLFQFAFVALPPILFISAFFTVLYHFGILQWIVRLMAKVMVYLMGTSGAETLSVAANVFMGQTEAPLIVKPYVPRMTSSELFTLMVSGMAHISGGMMVVYINYGADPVAVMTTSVMACPCSLYLAKLFMPEISMPETSGKVHAHKEKSPYVNAIDAAAAGTGDGLRLALNVGAMLIVFIAFVALFDGLLSAIKPLLLMVGLSQEQLAFWPNDLSLKMVFGWVFSPVAYLIGVAWEDAGRVGTLLGAKLAINEHYAYLMMKGWKLQPDYLTPRSYKLAAFALTGFANFASVGIQIGGIGAMAPERRHDLAKLGLRALFVGFTATLVNAALAGIFIE